MDTTPESTNKVTMDFRGTELEALGWGLLCGILGILIIPAAWGAVPLCRWMAKSLKLSDGTEVSFEGRAADVWGWFAVAMLVGLLPQLSRTVEDPGQQFLAALLLGFALMPISAAIWLRIVRWFYSSLRLSCGTPLAFKGSYGALLGWSFLLAVSVYTIIGWAWAGVAMLRWVCDNIEGGGHRVRFVGTGGQ
jgi:hypothetical protein